VDLLLQAISGRRDNNIMATLLLYKYRPGNIPTLQSINIALDFDTI
jgi:hypothetical protein